jgi:anti-anti-sigma factor
VVSHRHCALLIRDNRVLIQDLKSTNGTFVNNQLVRGDRALQHGDWLRVGPLDFDVEIRIGPTVSEMTPLPPTKGSPAGMNDEAAGALLLSLPERQSPAGENPPLDQEGIPTGETAMDLSVRQPVEWEEVGGALAIYFTDRMILDDERIQLIGQQLIRLIKESRQRKLLLDLGRVRAMSSAMIDRLVAFSGEVRAARGRLVLCNIHPSIYPVFQQLKQARTLDIRQDEQEGLQALR